MASIGAMGDLLKQAQEMQSRMAKIQEELANKTVQGSAGGGMVQVTVNGQFNLTAVQIEPSVINADGKGNVGRSHPRGSERRHAQGARPGVERDEQTHRRIEDSRTDAMTLYPAPLARLVQELSRLPGIGEKTAARLAFHMLKGNKDDVLRLADSIGKLRQDMGLVPPLFRLQRSHRRKRRRRALRNLPQRRAGSGQDLRRRRTGRSDRGGKVTRVSRPVSRTARHDFAARRRRSRRLAHQGVARAVARRRG